VIALSESEMPALLTGGAEVSPGNEYGNDDNDDEKGAEKIVKNALYF
jgi:hypothetical protein